MSKRPATLHDVAALVGVSARTVSRVVRDEGGCSPDTRERVLAAVDELGYRPNVHARGLISGRSGSLGLVVPVLSDPFFPELAEGVQRSAHDAGLTMLFAMSGTDPDVQHDVLSSLEGHHPEGVVVFPAQGGTEPLVPFLDRGMPMVVVDAEIEHPNAVSVRSDLADGARQAVCHLLGRGCRQLAMLVPFDFDVERQRPEAFSASLPDEMEAVLIDAPNTFEGGMSGMETVLSERPDVDGVFCFNDVMAIGAIQTAHKAGKFVPDDIAVVGFDDVQMGAVISPALTTIRIDRQRLGSAAVDQVRALSNGDGGRSVVLPVELIQRASA